MTPSSDEPKPRVAPPCALVVFGASGDLTTRKLMPAIAELADEGQLPPGFTVVGVARTEMTDEDFQRRMADAAPDGGAAWREVARRFRYVAGDYAEDETFTALAGVLDQCDRDLGTSGNRVHYLATVPGVFAEVARGLGRHRLNQPGGGGSFSRLVVEKPYGHDLESAAELDAAIHPVFGEQDLYRIDHYLGKETVQNVLAMRFANAIFEPVWNRRYVDHVQITVAESLGVGHRGGFYETAGAMRDIVQNHVLQVLALMVMEPPAGFDPRSVRDEKVKALRAVRLLDRDEVRDRVVRGQYQRGRVDGEDVLGYCEEEGVAADSTTETYMAARLDVDNWRWAGVPFYVRTGKRLPRRVTEVALQFKEVPHLPFESSQAVGLHANVLVVRIQPDEGITLSFGAKVPGQDFHLRDVYMDFDYSEAFQEEPPEAYERLLLDAMMGDPTLFIRADEVRQAWCIVEPILAAWEDPQSPLARYDAGTWGPAEADRLISRDGREWRRP